MALVVEGQVCFSRSGDAAWLLVEDEPLLRWWWDDEALATLPPHRPDHEGADRLGFDLRPEMRSRVRDGQRATLVLETEETQQGRGLRLSALLPC